MGARSSTSLKKPPAQKPEPARYRGRDLAPLALETYDLIIIGGGITGATILWDATLRGMKALLLEKNDYASGTTQATSKLIHGGLRYLRKYEFGLVRESLRERRTLARIAPHAVRPEGFLMPLYKHFGHGRAALGLGLWLYDALSYDRNRGMAAEAQTPPHRYLNRAETMVEEPVLNAEGLRGAYLYYDFANLNPERLCCEFIFSARARGAAARNYVEVGAVARVSGSGSGFEVRGRDRLTGQSAKFSARAVVNAAGPWADFLEHRTIGAGQTRLVRSKGIHIITRKIARDRALALTLPGPMKQHFFVLPWRGRSIIGTTDTNFTGHPDRIDVSQAEIQGLCDNVNTLTRANLKPADVEYYYAGLRPLLESEGGQGANGTYGVSRKTEIVHYASEGFPGFFTVLGGKYTTSRHLAEQLVDRLAEFLPGSFAPCQTATEPLGGGEFRSVPALEREIAREFPAADFFKIKTLVERYGEKARDILRADGGTIGGGARWEGGAGEGFYAEEIDYLAGNDEIQNLADLYFRRAGLGTAGLPPETVNRQIAERVGRQLGWTRAEVTRELRALGERFRV